VDFIDYLASLAAVLDANAVLNSLNYTEARGELAADLVLRGYEDVDRLTDRLEQAGVAVAITSVEQQDAGVRARIRLGGE
jgi:type II secretory pathway component PulL